MCKKYLLFTSLLLLLNIALFSQEDSTKTYLWSWKLEDGFLVEPTEFDTVINGFQRINPAEYYSISNTWLGNLGSAWMSNIYFNTFDKRYTDFDFDNQYMPYAYTRYNQRFYHSVTPYFNIHWTTSQRSRNENQLSALYTQNINEKWNVGFRYHLIASDGEFPNTLIKEHSMNPFFSYTGEKYSAYFAFMRNKFKTEESGGINDSITNDPAFAQSLLEKASSVYFKRSIFFSHEYKFGYTKKIVIDDSTTESSFRELGRINHVFNYDKNYRIYLENEPLSTTYYDNITTHYDNDNTKDSIRLMRMENSLYWSFKEINRPNFKGRLTVGGSLENLKWDNTILRPFIDSINTKSKDTAWVKRDTSIYNKHYNNIKLYGSLDARTKMFVFSANASYYMGNVLGETNKADNFEGNLLISKSIMLGKKKSDVYFKLRIGNYSPTIFQQRYNSNHYVWKNDFKNMGKTHTRVGLKIPITRTEAEFAYGLETNYIYYDSLAMPQQYTDKVLNIMSFRLHQDFVIGKNNKIGRFNIKNKIVYQLAPSDIQDVIRLPKVAVYHTSYYEMDYFLKVKKLSINVQLGYDVYYSTTFKSLGYNPAVGQFYNSNYGRISGDYPMLTVFLNARIKSTLIFFKYENIFNYLVEDKFYFVLDRYSINTPDFRFGVSWRFKN